MKSAADDDPSGGGQPDSDFTIGYEERLSLPSVDTSTLDTPTGASHATSRWEPVLHRNALPPMA